MSSGYPKESSSSLQEIGGLTVKSSMDACKGCRRFCSSFIRTLAQNRFATVFVITLPMLAMGGFIIYLEAYMTVYLQTLIKVHPDIFRQYKTIVFAPLYTLASITFLFGLLALWAVHSEYQNMLHFCSFVYKGIAHWVLLTVFLLMVPILGYLPATIFFQVVVWSYVPVTLWLFTAAVMTGHGQLITAAIELRNRVVASVDTTFGEV